MSWSPRACRVCTRTSGCTWGQVLRAREGSLDIAQSVCREVLEDIRSDFEYRNKGAFLRWLFSTALSKIRDRHRFHKRQRRTPEREDGCVEDSPGNAYATLLSPSRDAIGREDLERLERAFDQLPEQYREVITLARIVGMPRAEIAEQLGTTSGAVRTMLGRALARLSELHGE